MSEVTFETLENDLNRAENKRIVCFTNNKGTLQSILASLEEVRDQINSSETDAEATQAFTKLTKASQSKKYLENVQNQHFQYYPYLSRYGKDMDKCMNQEKYQEIEAVGIIEEKPLLNSISEYFEHEGLQETNKMLIEEANSIMVGPTSNEGKTNTGMEMETINTENKRFMAEFKHILEDLNSGKAEMALEWAKKTDGMSKDLKGLIFELHEVQVSFKLLSF